MSKLQPKPPPETYEGSACPYCGGKTRFRSNRMCVVWRTHEHLIRHSPHLQPKPPEQPPHSQLPLLLYSPNWKELSL